MQYTVADPAYFLTSTEVPASIGKLKNLKEFYCYNNKLTGELVWYRSREMIASVNYRARICKGFLPNER